MKPHCGTMTLSVSYSGNREHKDDFVVLVDPFEGL